MLISVLGWPEVTFLLGGGGLGGGQTERGVLYSALHWETCWRRGNGNKWIHAYWYKHELIRVNNIINNKCQHHSTHNSIERKNVGSVCFCSPRRLWNFENQSSRQRTKNTPYYWSLMSAWLYQLTALLSRLFCARSKEKDYNTSERAESSHNPWFEVCVAVGAHVAPTLHPTPLSQQESGQVTTMNAYGLLFRLKLCWHFVEGGVKSKD